MKSLNEADATLNGMEMFNLWFEEAMASGIPEANAMTLATCTLDAKPSARVVLLKNATSFGFVFYTNYESRKGEELSQNPNACLVFFWRELERQVRIEGSVKKISREESEQYFYSRPFQSQVSAVISPQSKIINGKKDLELLHQKTSEIYEGEKIPFPDFWGGYIVIPSSIEFWQGRENRFHDRLLYKKNDIGWTRVRLAP